MGDLSNKVLSWLHHRLEINESGQNAQSASDPTPIAPTDQRLYALVEDRLRASRNTSASVSQAWGPAAGMWFTEVVPTQLDAAFLSVAFDGHDLVSVVVGRTWFEMFPINDDFWQELQEIVDAVFAGQVVEQGRPEQTAAILGSESSQIKVGAWPAEVRPERRYVPYDCPAHSPELGEQA